MKTPFRMDRTAVRVSRMGEEPRDLTYWLTRTPEERLAAVQFLRNQYAEPGARLQRVYRIVKLEKG
jgi:hypothetical protein